jgi:hypothetical protein
MLSQARALLLRLKESTSPQFTFIHDHHDVSQLPARFTGPATVLNQTPMKDSADGSYRNSLSISKSVACSSIMAI